VPDRRRVPEVVLAGLTALTVLATLVSTPVRAAAPRVTCAADAGTEVAASAAAVRCGGRVEALDQRSERSQTFANADGSFTVELSSVSRWVRQAGGGWTAVDATLRQSGGRVRPVATTVPLSFSGGADGPLVRVAEHWSLSWPGRLPVPVLAGDTATYPQVRPGVDLVLRALPDGFTYVLVIKDAVAAADPGLRRVRLAVTGPPLRATANGGVEAVGPDGAVALVSGRAAMWDSAGATAQSAVSARGSIRGPAMGARQGAVNVETSGRDLVLVPDPAFLTEPGRSYPVFLDPQINAPRNSWAYANSANYSYDAIDNVARVGRNPECCGGLWRSFFQFDIGQVAGKRIKAAEFKSQLVHTWNCTDRSAVLYLTDAIPWGLNQGRVGWSPGLQAALNTQWGHAGCGNDTLLRFPIKDQVQGWANARWGQATLGLVAGDESSVQNWLKFAAPTTALVIDYNSVPNTAAAVDLTAIGTSQTVGCVAGPGRPRLNVSNGVRLVATGSEPDAEDAIRAIFAWNDLSIGSENQLPDTPAFASPHTFTVDVPGASLPNGHDIQWRVRFDDGKDSSDWSPWCQFTVDNRTPGQPTMTAYGAFTPFPAEPQPGTVVGGNYPVTFTPSPGDTDIVGYLYSLGAVETPPTIWVPAGANGTATVPMTPVVSGLAKNFITYVAVDRAGNRSPVPVSGPDRPGARQFRASPAPVVERTPGDQSGDGKAELVTLGDLGGGRSTLWRWSGLTAGNGVVGNPVAPQELATTYPTGATLSVTGDFDGDGLTDVALAQNGGSGALISVQRSDRNLLLGTEPVEVAGWNVGAMKLVAANFDRDPAGRDDIGVLYNSGNQVTSLRVLIATGTPGSTSFAAPVTWFTGNLDWGSLKPFGGDFDGDGFGDVGYLRAYSGCQSKVWAHFGSGTAFAVGVELWDSTANAMCWDRAEVASGDVDNDGAGDIVLQYRADGCRIDGRALFGQATRSLAPTPALTTLNGGFGTGCTTFTPWIADLDGDGRGDLATLVRFGRGFQARLLNTAATGRAFVAPVVRWAGSLGPAGEIMEANILLGARVSASSSAPDSWGWAPRFANDGGRSMPGWSSWSDVNNPHTEWFAFTLDVPRPVNRVDIYPRDEAGHIGESFPTNLTIEVLTDAGWVVVLERTNYPRPSGAGPQIFTFPNQTAHGVRIVMPGQTVTQFVEFEAYAVG
jgi:hypothetical protein